MTKNLDENTYYQQFHNEHMHQSDEGPSDIDGATRRNFCGKPVNAYALGGRVQRADGGAIDHALAIAKSLRA